MATGLHQQQPLPLVDNNNQLKFNMKIPTTINNLVHRNAKPNVIIIEKFKNGSSSPQQGNMKSVDDPPREIEFTAASKDRLDLAMKLVKQDLKKDAFDKKTQQEKSRQQSPPRYENEKKKNNNNRDIRIVEQGARVPPRDVAAQTGSRNSPRHPQNSPRFIVQFDGHEPQLYTAAAAPGDQNNPSSREKKEEKAIREIKSLRKELRKCVEDIDKIARKGMEDGGDDLTVDPDEDPRRLTRADEQRARSSRVLYSLRQQVRDIQNEIDKVDNTTTPIHVKNNKKTQAVNRLAAVHRGTVRALQEYLTHLSDRRSPVVKMPPVYQEMALLIKQLSVLCTKLNIDHETLLPDLLQLLKASKELETICNRQPSKQAAGPPRRRDRIKSPTPVLSVRSERGRVTKPKRKQKPLAQNQKHLTFDPYYRPDSPPTPERDASLRAGIQALRNSDMPIVNKQRNSTAPQRKGVLLPHRPNKPAKRTHFDENPRTSATVAVLDNNDVHYAQPTISSRLRSISPEDRERLETSIIEHTPHHTPSPPPYTRDCKLLHKELQRQAWLDKLAVKKAKEREDMDNGTPSGSVVTDQLVSDVDALIHVKLKPLLGHVIPANDVYMQFHAMDNDQIRDLILDKLGNGVSVDCHELSDSILQDLVDSVLSSKTDLIERSDPVTSLGVRLQDQPTLDSILNQLERMEAIDEDVRRRWTSMRQREDPYMVGGSEGGQMQRVFGEPQPVYNRSTNPSDETIDAGRSTDGMPPGPFEIHRPHPFTRRREHLDMNSIRKEVQMNKFTSGSRDDDPLMFLHVPAGMMKSLKNGKQGFDSYLKRTANQTRGSFDPWKVVDKISDEIVDDVLLSVAAKFGDACDNSVDNIFKKELTKDPTI